MTRDKSDVELSNLEVDSEIRDLNICSDDNNNWYIKVGDSHFLSKNGEIVGLEDNNYVPNEARISSIIKCQEVVQLHRDDIDISDYKSNSSEDSGDNVENIGHKTKKDSYETNINKKADNLKEVKSDDENDSDVLTDNIKEDDNVDSEDNEIDTPKSEDDPDNLKEDRTENNKEKIDMPSLEDNSGEMNEARTKDNDESSALGKLTNIFNSDKENNEENVGVPSIDDNNVGEGNRIETDKLDDSTSNDETEKNDSENEGSILNKFTSVFDDSKEDDVTEETAEEDGEIDMPKSEDEPDNLKEDDNVDSEDDEIDSESRELDVPKNKGIKNRISSIFGSDTKNDENTDTSEYDKKEDESEDQLEEIEEETEDESEDQLEEIEEETEDKSEDQLEEIEEETEDESEDQLEEIEEETEDESEEETDNVRRGLERDEERDDPEFNIGQEDEDNEEVEQTGKNNKKDVSIPTLMILGLFLGPIAYYYIGENKLAIINAITFNYLFFGWLIVPIHCYTIINKEIVDDKEKQDVKSETEENKSDEDSRTIIESIKLFFSSEIAEINQNRPDAQNVSINYINYENNNLTWSETISDFWEKLNKSRSEGYESIEKDVKHDALERYKGLLKTNEYARGDMIDVIFTLSLTGMGVLLIFIGLITAYLGNIGGLEALTQSSGYGDQIFLTTILLSITSLMFWLSRRLSQKTIVSIIRKPSRLFAGLLLFTQVSVVLIIGYILTIGGGQAALGDLEVFLDTQIVEPAVYSVVGAPIIQSLLDVNATAESILQIYYNLRGPETSIFGLNILQASIFMTIVGILTAYPVIKRSIARLVLTVNMGPREFREKTGILTDQLSETESSYSGPDYVMGGEGKVEDIKEDAIEYYEDTTAINDPDESEKFLVLPESMRGSPFKDYEEVRRYWVRAPYAYVSIVHNERQNDYRYVVVEPELDETEEVILDDLEERLDDVLLLEDVEEKEDYEEEVQMKLDKLEKQMIELSQEYNIKINDETFHRLMYYIEREYVYYSKIDPLLNDPNVEDISCDGEDTYIFVFHSDYKDVMTNVKFEKEELRSFIQELAQRSGEHISKADPMVDASLPDGSRAQMTLGSEVTTRGSTFTIRLFEDIPFTPVDLLSYDTFSMKQMAYLWTAIEHNKSLIFAGGTASGKTTSMNAVSMFIPPKAKVITIEDTREISLPQENWIPGTTREGVGGEEGGEDIDMYELLRAALRQRPEYIVVGEIRGREAETLFQAMNTGHTTYSTMHAETVDAAIGRLTNPPINVPKQMITALDIICIQNQIRFTDEHGNVQNVRRNEETREIVGLRESGAFQNRRPFQWDAETDTFIESLEDSYVLQRISEENGWTQEDRNRQIKQRQEVLEYMVDNDIQEFDYVTNIIQAYMVDSEKIINQVRNDTLEPSDLESLTDMNWDDEPDEELNKITEMENKQNQKPQLEGDQK